MDGCRPGDREPRSGAVVHGWLPPCAPRRGLACHAGPVARLPSASVQFLRSQPGARRAAGRRGQGREMIRRLRAARIAVSVLLLLLAAQRASAQTPAGAGEQTSLLYLAQGDWEQQSATRKIALAADFMRIFCTDPTMSPAALADCLDKDKVD